MGGSFRLGNIRGVDDNTTIIALDTIEGKALASGAGGNSSSYEFGVGYVECGGRFSLGRLGSKHGATWQGGHILLLSDHIIA